MLRIAIIEDETLAANKLETLIHKYDEKIVILAKLASVKDSVKWFSQNPAPDLIFMDIHLEDGLSFAIFEIISIQTPVVFTTAFDEYTINAFKVNGIDYLLKPISFDDLSRSFDKYHQLRKQFSMEGSDIQNLLESFVPKAEQYKSRFLINEGNNLITVATSDAAYFFAEDKFTYLVTGKGKQHLIDFTLERLFQLLDPRQFYRINRQFIVSAHAIANLSKHATNKLKVNLDPPSSREVFVSMDRYSDFKKWLDN